MDSPTPPLCVEAPQFPWTIDFCSQVLLETVVLGTALGMWIPILGGAQGWADWGNLIRCQIQWLATQPMAVGLELEDLWGPFQTKSFCDSVFPMILTVLGVLGPCHGAEEGNKATVLWKAKKCDLSHALEADAKPIAASLTRGQSPSPPLWLLPKCSHLEISPWTWQTASRTADDVKGTSLCSQFLLSVRGVKRAEISHCVFTCDKTDFQKVLMAPRHPFGQSYA